MKTIWKTEIDLPYGEQPRIHSSGGRLVAVVGNMEMDQQDQWEEDAILMASAPAMQDEIARLRDCINMAMGRLDPDSRNADERIAWKLLFDGISA